MGVTHAGQNVNGAISDNTQLERDLAATSQDKQRSIEERIDATLALANFSGSNALIAVARASRDEHPGLREAAIFASSQWSAVAKWDLVSPLLNDENSQVQGAAIRHLLPLREHLNNNQLTYMDKQTDAYIEEHLAAPSIEKARLYIAQQRYEEAFILLNRLASFTDSREQAQLLISEIYIRKGAYDKAQQHVALSLKEFNTSAPLYFQEGIIYVHKKDYQHAEQAFYHAYQLSPSTERYLLAYASLVQRHDAKEASVLYRQLYGLNANPQYLYASCQFQIESGEDAQSCLSELAQIAPPKVVATLQ